MNPLTNLPQMLGISLEQLECLSFGWFFYIQAKLGNQTSKEYEKKLAKKGIMKKVY